MAILKLIGNELMWFKGHRIPPINPQLKNRMITELVGTSNDAGVWHEVNFELWDEARRKGADL